MATPSTPSNRKAYITVVRIISVILLTLMLNAVLSVSFAVHIQNQVNENRANDIRQSRIVVNNLCKTLTSLHADNPPGNSPTPDPARAYLLDLHDRLGELAVDLKC